MHCQEKGCVIINICREILILTLSVCISLGMDFLIQSEVKTSLGPLEISLCIREISRASGNLLIVADA